MQTYLLLFVAMAAIFYFLILRPQQRAKRAKAELASTLDEGSEVLTVGGIYGTIVELRENDFDLEIASGAVMRLTRNAIASVVPDAVDDDEDDEGDEVDDIEDEVDDIEDEADDIDDEDEADDIDDDGSLMTDDPSDTDDPTGDRGVRPA